MKPSPNLSPLARDTLNGLSAEPKYLLPKYFYDDAGSRIFQNIMNMPEYYLTDCELEILNSWKNSIVSDFNNDRSSFDLIELGSGDGLKTKILLRQLTNEDADFTFIPVDISSQAINGLIRDLNHEFPGLSVKEKTGDYFQIMDDLRIATSTRKIILFLGSNIGNFSDIETDSFLSHLAELTNPGDQAMIGFDLKKFPEVILKAYDDPYGHTRQFNLNLLSRLNRELGADFNLTDFLHHISYDPVTGEVRSYLVSKADQSVSVKTLNRVFHFKRWEAVFTERSRKYDVAGIEKLAAAHGFKLKRHFFDKRKYFCDSLWVKI